MCYTKEKCHCGKWIWSCHKYICKAKPQHIGIGISVGSNSKKPTEEEQIHAGIQNIHINADIFEFLKYKHDTDNDLIME